MLEADYKCELAAPFNLHFSHFYFFANMPIQRFGNMLVTTGKFAEYMALLKESYFSANLESVMCRNVVSVDWQGYLYDCDFNQMLSMPALLAGKARPHLFDLLHTDVDSAAIAVADHYYGCTAGQGSSCGGALA